MTHQNVPPHRCGHVAEAKRLAIEADLLQGLVLVPRQGVLNLGQGLLLRSAKDPDEDPLLAEVSPLDGQAQFIQGCS